MDLNVIKSYLVGLGFKVDDSQFNKMLGAVKQVGSQVEQHTSKAGKRFTELAVVVGTAYASIAASTAVLMESVAKADLGYQLFALHMYMNVDTAKKVKIAMDALGEPLENIAYNPELRRRWFELMAMQEDMKRAMPGDFSGQMAAIRDVRFEFTKLHIEFNYFVQTFVSNIFKAFGTDITDFHKKFRAFNDWIKANIPDIAHKVATSLVPILQTAYVLAGSFYKLLKTIAGGFMDLFGILSGDESLKGTEVTFDKVARAMQYVNWLLGSMMQDFILLTRIIANFAHIAGLFLTGHPTKAHEAAQRLGEDVYEDVQTRKRIELTKPTSKATPPGWTRDAAAFAAQEVSAQTGIPANIILGQWAFETGNFTNRGAVELNNFAGIKNVGGVGYRNFASVSDFADYYTKLMQGRYKGAMGAQTPEDFAAALKAKGYYESPQDQYAAGIKRHMRADMATSYSTTIGDVTVNVNGSNASPEEIRRSVMAGIEDARQKQITRDLRMYKGING